MNNTGALTTTPYYTILSFALFRTLNEFLSEKVSYNLSGFFPVTFR